MSRISRSIFFMAMECQEGRTTNWISSRSSMLRSIGNTEGIAYNAVIGGLEERGFRIRVDRHNDLALIDHADGP